IGLDEKAIRQLEIARAKENAVTQRQANEIDRLNGLREAALDIEAKRQRVEDAEKETRGLLERVEATRREAQVLELVRWAREKALLQMEREAELKPILTRQTEALARGEAELSDELQKQIDLIDEQFGLRIQMGNRSDQLMQWEERYG